MAFDWNKREPDEIQIFQGPPSLLPRAHSDTRVVVEVTVEAGGGSVVVEHGGNGSIMVTSYRRPYGKVVREYVCADVAAWQKIIAAIQALSVQ